MAGTSHTGDRAASMLDKIWSSHVVADLGDGWALLHIDRHLLHDLSGGRALEELNRRGLRAANPGLCFATPDHAVSTAPGRAGDVRSVGGKLRAELGRQSEAHGIRFFDVGAVGQGIVHVMAPELGIALPGCSLICGDSHTCTNGGLGALAFGVGSSELVHALATQTLRLRRPRSMRVSFEGEAGAWVTPKDMMLHLIARYGTAGGTGFAVEYAGAAVRALSVEARLTLCNLSIEFGARMGFIAPDDTVFDYVRGRPYAPEGAAWDAAVEYWRSLPSDTGAMFDAEIVVDMNDVAPGVTWGISPEHAIPVDGVVPDPDAAPDEATAQAWRDALAYMDLRAGQRLAGTKLDWVFIGSCTNSRISDLRAAAAMLRDGHVADGVTAWVVPGSEQVKRAAEAEGLDQVFRAAGFDWREPGCSMCVAANGDVVPAGQRAISTTNRNFVGRQGPGARTHLASPQMAALAAITGAITDPRGR